MKSLLIENFKNIKKLQLESLKRVNLIVGKNNVGKSTLLEAIALYLAQGVPSYLVNLLERRGELTFRQDESDEERKDHFLSFFNNYNESYKKSDYVFVGENVSDPLKVRLNQVYVKEYIEKDEDGNERRMRTRLFEEDLKESDTMLEPGLLITSSMSGLLTYGGLRRLWTSKDSILPFQFVDARISDSEQNAILFDRISLSPDENDVVDALRIINPQIERITFVTSSNKRDRYPIVTLKNDSRRYRLKAMGDGINRILTIILAMLSCKNGVLLLDEFETGLHYSVQEQLWNILFYLSEKFNIQVFATSHSRDCIEGFANQNNSQNGLLIRLENRNEEIVPVQYTNKDDILFAIKKDIEIR